MSHPSHYGIKVTSGALSDVSLNCDCAGDTGLVPLRAARAAAVSTGGSTARTFRTWGM
jgi:hypothetical protein